MDSLGSDLQDLEHHQLPSSADLFYPGDHKLDMNSASDHTQHKDTGGGAASNNSLSVNSPFLNGAGGNNMGMVIAALQSLGGNSRTPNRSDGETQAAAHNEDSGVGQGQGQLREQIILEQFKLAQLKQLQEIQQQIFQQQMALLNSGTASLESQPRDQTQRGFHGLPTPGSSTEIRPSQPIPVEFVSPMLLNYNDMDSSSVMSLEMSGQNPYPRNNSASHTPVFSPHDPVGLDLDMNNFAAAHSQFSAGDSTVTGNRFPSSSPFSANPSNSNSSSSGNVRTHDYYFAHRGTASAPAHIAFGNPYHSSQNGMNMHGSINALNMSSEPSSPLHSELDFDVSPLTSPWLGAKMTGNGTGSNGRVQPYGHHHQNQSQNRNQNQMLPHSTTHAGMKRAASPSTADIDVDIVFGGASDEIGRSRKRQASISQSPNAMRPLTSKNTSSKSSRAPGSGSRSMNSTPLLRGTDPNANSRPRKGSVISSSPLAMAMGQAGMSGISGFPRMPSPAVESSSSRSSSKGGTNRNNHSENTPSGNGDNSNMGYAIVGDSPSPVDLSLSMPPPAAPASAFGATGTSSGSKLPESLVPVTPASIMNLGNSFVGLGSGLGNATQTQPVIHTQNLNTNAGSPSGGTLNTSNNSTSNYGAAAGSAKSTMKGPGRGSKNDKNDTGATGPRKSGRKAGVAAGIGDNTGLKHILPAANPSHPSLSLRPSSNSSSISAAATSSTTTIVPVKERKTSHKAAEQKRRDSLKTTFDDLRGLLPPIPLPTDGDSKSGGAAAVDDETGIGFMALAKASLLPGALPPRGPPKAGEGPNKGVSKLQLLVCGNEYIRVLKGRVDRRDEEVEKLRREVRRLRSKLEESGLAEVKEDSGGGGGGGRDGNEKQGEFLYKYGEMLDLDRDLDAVEVLESMRISSSGLSPSLSGGGSLIGVDEDEED